MAKLSKKEKLIKSKVQKTKQYSVHEAVELLREFASEKFQESIDVSVNLGVDPRKSDQNVRGATVLPNGTGKNVRVAVFAQGPNADAAKEAGADVVVVSGIRLPASVFQVLHNKPHPASVCQEMNAFWLRCTN